MKENIGDINLRELYLKNFMTTLLEDYNIPVHILIEPLISTIRTNQGTTFFFTNADFEFFNSISKHPRL